MSAQDYIYCYQGKALRVGSGNVVVGSVYKDPTPSFDSVTIGSQTWMSKNLAIDDGQGGIYTQTVNYGQGDVVEYYYEWGAAMRVAANVQGWHLPTASEWSTLADAVGLDPGTKLKSTYGWDSGVGTDNYQFAAFPAGYHYHISGSFLNLGIFAYFWTATEYSSSYAYGRYFSTDASMYSYDLNKSLGYSVRLVKDAE